jgi:hypothetical protein
VADIADVIERADANLKVLQHCGHRNQRGDGPSLAYSLYRRLSRATCATMPTAIGACHTSDDELEDPEQVGGPER